MTYALLIIFGFIEFVLRLLLFIFVIAMMLVLTCSVLGWVVLFGMDADFQDLTDLLKPFLWSKL